MRSLFFAGFLVLVMPVHAAPVTYVDDGNVVTVANGGYAYLTGSFDYDAVTGDYTNLNFVVTGSLDLEFITDDLDPFFHPQVISLNNGSRYWPDNATLFIEFTSPITGQVGDVAVIDEFSGRDYGSDSNYSVGLGSFTAVPIPAAVWLFGSALAGLGWMKRKQTV